MMTSDQSRPPQQGRFRRFLSRIGLARRPEPQRQVTMPHPTQQAHPQQAPAWPGQPAPQQQLHHQYAQPVAPHPAAPYPHPNQLQQPQYQPVPPQHYAPAPQPAQQPAQVQQAPAPQPEQRPQPVAAAQPVAEQPPVPVPAEQRPLTDALASLAIRDLTLVDSMLAIVEDLEETTDDPGLLDQLFKIDNLATRMRRNGENLLVLADQETGDPRSGPVPLLDVARAAVSEIKDYNRVNVGRLPETFLSGMAADDISHLLAELLDNATAKSPDHAQVVISGQPMDDGRLLLVVEDEGIGIPKDQLTNLNSRLSGTPELDEDVIRHMGIYVVSRIAHRHGLEVQLEPRAFRGTSAFVVVPADLLHATGPAPEPEPVPAASMSTMPTVSRSTPPPVSRAASTMSSSLPDRQGPRPHDSSGSAVTAAGLPRRSANRSTTPLPMADQQTEQADERPQESAEDRAERIRADLDGFLEGERAALEKDDG
ncbi:sensor histidine kinase [Allonocardiopsis opalescens]|nr:ATP-binding protein [Allonocardiopsis opalescens]